MSELQQMEAPPAYNTTTSPAPVYDGTTTTTAATGPATAPTTQVKVTTTAPTATAAPYTSIWDQRPGRTVSTTPRYYADDSVNTGCLVLSVICCTFLGALAFFFNHRGKEYFRSGSYEAGRRSIRTARVIVIVAIVLGTLLTLGVIGAVVAEVILQQNATNTFRRPTFRRTTFRFG